MFQSPSTREEYKTYHFIELAEIVTLLLLSHFWISLLYWVTCYFNRLVCGNNVRAFDIRVCQYLLFIDMDARFH